MPGGTKQVLLLVVIALVVAFLLFSPYLHRSTTQEAPLSKYSALENAWRWGTLQAPLALGPQAVYSTAPAGGATDAPGP